MAGADRDCGSHLSDSETIPTRYGRATESSILASSELCTGAWLSYLTSNSTRMRIELDAPNRANSTNEFVAELLPPIAESGEDQSRGMIDDTIVQPTAAQNH